MDKTILFSVIIPHRDSILLLNKLLDSIPPQADIEVLVIDNSFIPINNGSIQSKRDFKLLYSSPERGAGGARNTGIEEAHGKWIVFADADDFFEENAFDVYRDYVDSDADIVYSCARGIYSDTGLRSTRGDHYTELVRGYIDGRVPEVILRLGFSVPWCKMVKRELVNNYNIRFDEVPASNDLYFSMLIGYYANSIFAIPQITYAVTVSKGTLTRRRDYYVLFSRYCVYLRYNKFVRDHGYSSMQKSVMGLFVGSSKKGLRAFVKNIGLLLKYRQNPFIGASRWIKTYKSVSEMNKKESQYITY